MQPLISWYTAEHAKDKGRHHAFFASVLTKLWPQLTHSQQEAIGKLVPKLVKIFLQPEVAIISADLASLAFTRDEIEQIVAETVTSPESIAGIAMRRVRRSITSAASARWKSTPCGNRLRLKV